jgi:hypothetical protein
VKVRVSVIGLTLAVAAVLGAVTTVLTWPSGPSPQSPVATKAPVSAPRHVAFTVTGIVTNNLAVFHQRCRCYPTVVVHYIHWGETLETTKLLADSIIASTAVPMVELEPFDVSLPGIAEGRDDGYLRRCASILRDLHTRVLMSFAPESNGTWYSWGYTHVKPAAEIAAWRHVVQLFRHAGARNVSWVWIANVTFHGSGPISALWPGHQYVDEVGIDGYFQSARATFSSVFGPTLATLRRITDIPALISETAADPAAGQPRVLGQLAAGVVQYELAGFIWFDIDQVGQHGQGKANWSIDDNGPALGAYREISNAHRLSRLANMLGSRIPDREQSIGREAINTLPPGRHDLRGNHRRGRYRRSC